MAGIGFELKKMFDQRGVLALTRAYGYAGIVCVGPMILGVALLAGVRLLALGAGATRDEAELLNSMITYTLLYSLFLANSLALVLTRYSADEIYLNRADYILPSFWGSTTLLLLPGALSYGVFLHFAGISLPEQLLCFILLGELILVWTQITYLTAIKDYRGILLAFLCGLLLAWLVGWLLLTYLALPLIPVLLFTVGLAYGVMLLWYNHLLTRYFPKGHCSSLYFLSWLDRYPQLFWIGLLISVGLFGHLVIMWASPLQKQISGWFYGTPQYDVPALIAFFSILVTTVSFVTSVEVNFYPQYRNYFSLFNDGGALVDIRQAQQEMTTTLIRELTYTFIKQLFSTILFIILGTLILPQLPLGFNDDMLGIYRVLCLGYAFYALGNALMLILLYFANDRAALTATAVFAFSSCLLTWLWRQDNRLAGLGFLAGSLAFTLTGLLLLRRYLNHLIFNILCSQPVVIRPRQGWLSRLGNWAQRRYLVRYPRQQTDFDDDRLAQMDGKEKG